MLSYFINLGILPDMDDSKKRTIQLHNKLMLTLALVATLRLFIDLIDFSLQGILIDAFIIFLCSSCFYFTKKNQFYVATVIGMAFFLIFAVSMKIVYGPDSGVDFTLVMAMAFITFFFRDKKEWGLIIFCYISSFIGTTWWVSQNGPMIVDPKIVTDFYYTFFIGGSLSMLLVLDAVVQERESYQKKTEQLLGDLKENETQLHQQKKDLEQANSDLERFVYMASHDLKTPLRNITSFIQLIGKKTEQLGDPALDTYMGFVQKGASNMQELISGILDFSKILKPKIELIDLNQVIEDVTFNLQGVINEKNACLELDQLPQIYADHSQMVMLFQNLIQNGIKYNDQSQPILKVKSLISADTCRILIIDNGIGISPEFHQKVFEMFSRLHNSEQYAGTGIGLATCQRIMEKTGGAIGIAKSEGQGSTFYLEWPIAKIAPADALEEAMA